MNNWTPDRPTKPGKYWLSVHPDKRKSIDDPWRNIPARLLVELNAAGWVAAEGTNYWARIGDDLLDGAQWLPYVEPPDPFAEPVPSLRDRVEVLPRFDPAALDSRMLPHMQPTADGLFLARSDVLALFEVPQ